MRERRINIYNFKRSLYKVQSMNVAVFMERDFLVEMKLRVERYTRTRGNFPFFKLLLGILR